MTNFKITLVDLFVSHIPFLYLVLWCFVLSQNGGVSGTSPAGCGREEKLIEPGLQDGTKLFNLDAYVYPGTPETFLVSSFIVNNTEWSGLVSSKFRCGASFPYSDARKYICLRKYSGILKIRNNVDFASVAPYTRFEIIVRVHDSRRVIGTCTFIIIVKGPPTQPGPTVSSSTTSSSAKIVTSAPTKSKIASTSSNTFTKLPSTNSSITTSNASTTLAPTTTSTTTANPCILTNSVSKSLMKCAASITELTQETEIGNALSFQINSTSHVRKLSHMLIEKRNASITGRILSVKVYASSGNSKQLLKTMKINTAASIAEMNIDAYLPENCTGLSVEIATTNQPSSRLSLALRVFIYTYGFCSQPICSSLYQTWMRNFSSGNCARKLPLNPVAQFSACFDHCKSERTKIPSTDDYYAWPRTLAGTIASLPCSNNNNFATRLCRKYQNKEPKWGAVKDSDCQSINKQRQEKLDNINKRPITASNASATAQVLKNLTKTEPTSLPPGQLVKVTVILEKLAAFAGDESIAEEMLETVDNCLQAPEESFKQGQRSSNMSQRIVSLLSNVCQAMVRNRTVFTAVKKGFALAATYVNKSSFNGVSLNYIAASPDGSASNLSLSRNANQDSKDSTASIALPSSLLDTQQSEASTLVFVAYDQGKLFQQKGGGKLNSKIISAEVRYSKISKLSTPVVTKFKESDTSSAERLCVWWDFTMLGGQGGWSTDGCWLHKNNGGYTTCHCNHLTNFAVLLGAKTPVKRSSHQIALTVVSYVGVAISLVGVLFTLLSYTIFPKLRDNDPPKILMNLCGALALLLIIYAVGVERTNPREGCQAVAFLLHYALLCVLSWSAVEGFNSYRGIVNPMRSEVQHMIKKALVFGWGIPLIFPIVGIAVWTENYGNSESCVVKGMPLYTMLIAPVGVVMVMNAICIVCILSALNKSSKMYSHNAIKLLHRIRIIVAFVLLFSLTWLFGFLVVSNDIVAFQYIFCVLNSLQGFFIFLFYCVRNENVRKSWKEKLQATGQRRQTLSSSGATKKTDLSFDSAVYNKTDSLRSDDTLVKNGSLNGSSRVKLTSRANAYTTT